MSEVRAKRRGLKPRASEDKFLKEEHNLDFGQSEGNLVGRELVPFTPGCGLPLSDYARNSVAISIAELRT